MTGLPLSGTGHEPADVPHREDVLDFARSVALGLSDTPRWIPVRFLYDAAGSALFEEITEQPEYYPTRTEAAILAEHSADICEATGAVTLVELGAGSAVKTSHLFAAYTARGNPVTYVPVDVSGTALQAAKKRIATEHPLVRFEGVVGTYDDAFPLLAEHSPAMVMFLGSSVGNFAHAESYAFWEDLSASLPAGDYFLLGVDLVKDKHVLEAAYNDSAGVTAQFTVNLFERMNRELGSGIDIGQIRHVAHYNDEWQRIEIFAEFLETQEIYIEPLDRSISIKKGEKILVEISRKFVLENLTQFAACFDFTVERVYTDPGEWFAVLLMKKEA
jgi:L-histidine N-alpha-methyltransferase